MSLHFTEILDCTPLCKILVDDEKSGKLININPNQTSENDISLKLDVVNGSMNIALTADTTPISYVMLRFNTEFPSGTMILGDEWERGYGNLHFECINPGRRLPWYFAAYDRDNKVLYGCGVKVQPNSMCVWSVDKKGITLILDVRSRGRGVILGGRTLCAATVVCAEYDNTDAFSALEKFCALMSPTPRLPKAPVYGFNNWYYAYGKSSRENILTDSKLLSELTQGLENRPFMAIDDGWQIYENNVGMWSGCNADYGDMEKLASDMSALGVIPGIWIRPLKENIDAVPKDWRLTHFDGSYLDPTIPEVLDHIKADIKHICDCGFKLLKHDFTTYDMFGLWGRQMGFSVTNFNDSFRDRSITSAEAVLKLYRAIREAAGDAVIIGCNTFSHLSAGIFELCRIGDDTSGREWERTRRMGINCLAFRMAQNGHFYMNDADCVGHISRDNIPWELNSKWLKLVASSGSPLFVSCDPKTADDEIKSDLKAAFKINSVQSDKLIPLDWMDNSCPAEWLLNDTKEYFDWYDDFGYNPVTDPEMN